MKMQYDGSKYYGLWYGAPFNIKIHLMYLDCKEANNDMIFYLFYISCSESE